MESVQPFAPSYGSTIAVSVSGTATAEGVDRYAPNLQILNPNDFVVFVRCSDSDHPLVATDLDFPVGPNSSKVISKANGYGAVSIIAGTGNTGTAYLTTGIGF